MEQRLSLVEKDQQAHARILTEHNGKIDENRQRILAIEAARQARKEEEIRREESDKARFDATNVRLDAIEKSQGQVQSALARVTWIIITAVIGAVLAVVLKGGV